MSTIMTSEPKKLEKLCWRTGSSPAGPLATFEGSPKNKKIQWGSEYRTKSCIQTVKSCWIATWYSIKMSFEYQTSIQMVI